MKWARGFVLSLPVIATASILLADQPAKSNPSETAVNKAIPLLQHSASFWLKQTKCTSCHHQSLLQVSLAVAGERGFKFDRERAKEQDQKILESREPDRLLQYEGIGAINGSAGYSFEMFGYGSAKGTPTSHTDSTVYYLLNKQSTKGYWPSLSRRPPLEDSPVTLTALAIRALLLYSPPYLKEDSLAAIEKAKTWLKGRRSKDNEDAALKLLGLYWSRANSSDIQKAQNELLAMQREDGGWSQLPTRQSDAYATGQAIVALQVTNANTAQVKKGISFLIKSQLKDGSWLVPTRRRFPGLPYFDTGFPHGGDQFISFSGTAWAVMALAIDSHTGSLSSLRSVKAPPRNSLEKRLATDRKDDRLFKAVLYGSLDDVKKAIDLGANINARGLEGATPLMFAVRYPEKVAYLLQKGANPNLASKGKSTALTIALGFPKGIESGKLLLKAGANPKVINAMHETPLSVAVASGDQDRVKLLLDLGVSPNDAEGIAAITALSIQELPMLKLLIEHGLNVNQLVSADKDTLLMFAVYDGSDDVVKLLLDHGANPNHARSRGLTPLMVGAMSDPGHPRVIQTLLEHGADLMNTTPDGKSALSLAQKYNSPHLVQVLKSNIQSE